jgi:hypothetical protein
LPKPTVKLLFVKLPRCSFEIAQHLLKGLCHVIFASGFFMNQFSPPPQPQSIPLRPFRIFSKIRGDIRNSRCTTGINDTGGKFAFSVNDAGGNLPPVSTTPARWQTIGAIIKLLTY